MARQRAQIIASKRLVLDANILLRAVFGVRVRGLLEAYEDSVSFHCPDVCLEDARKYIPNVAARKSLDQASCLVALDEIAKIVAIVERGLYLDFKSSALARIASRDPGDWPIVATAMLLDAPIWTEDYDFFGVGIATWISDRVEQYLRATPE